MMKQVYFTKKHIRWANGNVNLAYHSVCHDDVNCSTLKFHRDALEMTEISVGCQEVDDEFK